MDGFLRSTDMDKHNSNLQSIYAKSSLENIEKGIQILGDLTYQFCK